MWMPKSGVSGSPRRGLRSRLVSLKAANSAGRIWSTRSLGSHGICAHEKGGNDCPLGDAEVMTCAKPEHLQLAGLRSPLSCRLQDGADAGWKQQQT